METASITLNAANIKWKQFYVSSVRELFFPSGRHEDTVFEIDIGGVEPVSTTIVPEYLYFRNRGWMRNFFESHALEVGDQIVIRKTGPKTFQLHVRKRSARGYQFPATPTKDDQSR
jgi:hypothetical protein